MTIRIAFVAAFAFSLVACGGGASSRSALPGIPGGTPASVGNATAQFVIKVPPKQGSAAGRAPAYVSPSTQSLSIQVDSGTPVTANLTPSSPNCSVPAPLSPLQCTESVSVTPGAHTFTIKTFDGLAGAGNMLSVNSAPFTVLANQSNVVNLTLAGVPASLLVEPAGGDTQIVGSGSAGLQFTGEGSHNIVVLPEDADGNIILGPGAPALAATLSSVSTGSGLAVATPAGSNPNEFSLSATGFGTASMTITATPAAAPAGSPLTATVSLLAAPQVTGLAGNGYSGYTDGTSSTATFTYPSAIAFDSANDELYVADYTGCGIRQVTLAGVVTTPYGSAPPTIHCASTDGTGNAALMGLPNGITYDATNGDFYVVDSNFGCGIRQITAAGVVSTLAGGTTCGYADGLGSAAKFGYNDSNIAYDSGNGYLYVADSNNCAIRQVNPYSGLVVTVVGAPPPTAICGHTDGTGTAATLSFDTGIAYDAGNQDIYVTEGRDIRQITVPTFAVTTLAGDSAAGGFVDGSGTSARFSSIGGVAVDSNDGNLYVTDTYNRAIRQVTTAGLVTTLAGSDPPTVTIGYADGFGFAARFSGPDGITYNSGTNTLYVTDTGNYSVVQVQL